MADRLVPNNDKNEEYISVVPAEMSDDDDIIGYIQVNSLDALKARFGTAEEDDSIRNEGFELAKSGGLIRKPRPETDIPFYAHEAGPKDDISTDESSDLSKIFDSAKSEHDNDNVYFGDLGLEKPKINDTDAPAEPENTSEAVVEEKLTEEKPKRKRRTKAQIEADKAAEAEAKKESDEKSEAEKKTRKRNPKVTEEKTSDSETEKKTEVEKASDDEEIQIVRKFNTNTRVIFVDESLDDGIKRNTESELEGLFESKNKERKGRLWSLRKK